MAHGVTRRVRHPRHPQPGALPLPAAVRHPARRDPARAGRRLRRRRLRPGQRPARGALTTSGPGITNAITALATAYADSVPTLAISPGAPRGRVGADVGLAARGQEPAGGARRGLRPQHPGRERGRDPRGGRGHLRGVRQPPPAAGAPRGAGRRPRGAVAAPAGAGAAPCRRRSAPAAPAVDAVAAALAGADEPARRRRRRSARRRRAGPRAGRPRHTGPDHRQRQGRPGRAAPRPRSGACVRLAAAHDAVNAADVLLLVGTEVGDADLWGGVDRPRAPGERTVVRVDLDPAQMHKNVRGRPPRRRRRLGGPRGRRRLRCGGDGVAWPRRRQRAEHAPSAHRGRGRPRRRPVGADPAVPGGRAAGRHRRRRRQLAGHLLRDRALLAVHAGQPAALPDRLRHARLRPAGGHRREGRRSRTGRSSACSATAPRCSASRSWSPPPSSAWRCRSSSSTTAATREIRRADGRPRHRAAGRRPAPARHPGAGPGDRGPRRGGRPRRTTSDDSRPRRSSADRPTVIHHRRRPDGRQRRSHDAGPRTTVDCAPLRGHGLALASSRRILMCWPSPADQARFCPAGTPAGAGAAAIHRRRVGGPAASRPGTASRSCRRAPGRGCPAAPTPSTGASCSTSSGWTGSSSIDAGEQMAVVQPGVVNADLSRAVAEQGLFYPPDPASGRPRRSAATSPRTPAASAA